MKSVDAWRRLAGISFLSLSGGMLLWGLTVLDSRLAGPSFVIYWTLCVVFTSVALMIALVDLRITRMRAQREKVHLMRQTLTEIATAVQTARDTDPAAGPPATENAAGGKGRVGAGHSTAVRE